MIEKITFFYSFYFLPNRRKDCEIIFWSDLMSSRVEIAYNYNSYTNHFRAHIKNSKMFHISSILNNKYRMKKKYY